MPQPVTAVARRSTSRDGRPLSARLQTWLGWTACVATFVLNGAGSGMGSAARAYIPASLQAADQWFRLTPIYAQAFAIVGALIVWRRPGNRVGWVCCGIGLLSGVEELVLGYLAFAGYVQPGRLPATGLANWLGSWVWILPVSLMLFWLPFLFPDGRLVSPRWRPLAWAALIGVTIGLAGATTGVFVLGLVGQLVLLACAILAPVTLAIRYRRASLEERQQIRWFAAAAILLAGIAVIATAVSFIGYHDSRVVFNPVGGVLIPLGLTALAASIGVSVLRYHLYDIDVFLRRAIVYAVLVALISFVYLVLVVAIGQRLDLPRSADRAIPFVVAAVIALIFQPFRTRLQRLANRLVYGRRATPYEVLANLSRWMSEMSAAEELPIRMAHVLADGTEADRAEVWLRVGSELRRAAAWPMTGMAAAAVDLDGESPQIPDAAETALVRYQGELLGALALVKREPMTPLESRLLADLAHEAGLALKNVRLTAELMQRLEELTASRQRLVTAQNDERRRIERNLHDGAQQNLIGIKLKLSLARRMLATNPPQAQSILNELVRDADEAVETLRELARGIYPPLLADQGLPAALEAHARRLPIRAEVVGEGLTRYPQEVEAATYFCCLEALQNVVKHAQASRVTVTLIERRGQLVLEVADNGRGITARVQTGSGIQNMRDRLAALGGRLDLRPTEGGGTTVTTCLPVNPPVPLAP